MRRGLQALIRRGGRAVARGTRRFTSSTTDGDRKARIAVVGAGWWAQGWHIPHLFRNKRVELAAIVEPNPNPSNRLSPDMLSADGLSKRYGVPVLPDMDALFGSAEVGRIDGVVIAAPHAAHQAVASRCISEGVNAFVEKPMTTDVYEAKSLAEQVRDSDNVVLMVNNTANWRAQSQRAAELVADGGVGTVRHASVFFGTPLGWLFNDPTMTGWVEPQGTMLGNGFGWGQMSHCIAWILMVSRLKPAKVFAFANYSQTSSADIIDSVTIKGDGNETLTLSGVATLPGSSKIIETHIVGDKGMLSYCGSVADKGVDAASDAADEGKLELLQFDKPPQVFPGFEFENTEIQGTGPESLEAFISACLGQPYYAGVDAELGFYVVSAIEAMYRSLASGRAEDAVQLR